MFWLVFLLLLICPLSMFMMKGHQHGSHSSNEQDCHSKSSHTNGQNQPSEPVRMDTYKMKQLEGEIELLKTQNEMLQEKVEKLSKNSASVKGV